MGQYYKAVIIHKNTIKTVDSWSHGNGAKLMEHSYYGNDFLNSVLGACWNLDSFRLGWVGDYSDKPEEFEINWKNNLHRMAYLAAWGDVEDVTATSNCNRLFGYHTPSEIDNYDDMWVCNADKMQAVRHRCTPLSSGIHISPFSILCAIGNGRGGGDYSGSNMFMVGDWAYDRLFLTRGGCPGGYMEIPEGIFGEE